MYVISKTKTLQWRLCCEFTPR